MSDTDSEILPCPFCGTDPVMWTVWRWGETTEKPWVITCPKCLSVGMIHTDKEEAIKLWNRRV